MATRSRKTSVRIGVIITAILAIVLGTASTAFAATETYENRATGYCLDSNANRYVYTNPCGSTYQNWTPLAAGNYRLLKNNSTGFCLDSNSNRNVYTNPCGQGNTYQQWEILHNGQFILFKNHETGYCLDSNMNRYVYTNPCGLGNTYQNWW